MIPNASEHAAGALTPQSAQLPGGRTSYLEAGSGPALVLLHGIGSAAASFDAQFDDLAADYRVIAWDAPGYGDSAPIATGRISAAPYAQRLRELLDHLGVQRCALLGHSLGAIVAGAFARDHARYIDGLILADPAAGYARVDEQTREDKLNHRLAALDDLGPAGLARARGPGLLSSRATPAQVAQVVRIMAGINIPGYRQAAHLLASGDLLADLAHWQGPTLVICGSEDRVTPPAGAQHIAQTLADARYQEIAQAGHASYIEQPGAFNQLVRQFLAAHCAARENGS